MSKKNKRDIPRFEFPIIETHCHLDYLKSEDLQNTLAKSREHGIEKLITIAVSPDNLQTVLALSEEHDMIFASQGVHPHDASKFNEDCLAQIEENLASEKVLAVGEIGLDYYYEHSDRKIQQKVFEQQLELAAEKNYPIIVHSRDADEDTLAILKNVSNTLQRKGVIHSFSSGLALAEACLAEGFSLGFNGMVTFKNADNVRAAVELCPLPQLLLETDAPYLTPAPYRGIENAPFYLPFIAEKIAEVKSLPINTVLQQCYDNSEALFWQA